MQAVVLGLIVLGGTALGGWAVVKIGARQGLFTQTYELRAGFRNASGLDRGTPVRVRGVDAGQVVAVELPDDPQGKVYVRLRLDRKFQNMVVADSRVQVLNEGVLGGRTINIDTGRERGRCLNDGDEIAVAEAQDLTDLMAEAGQTLREIRDSQGTLAKLLKSDEAHKEVIKLVQDTQQMVKKGQDTFDQTQLALKEGKEALTVLKQDAEAIKKLPLVRGYVEDTHALLFRPEQNGDRRIYSTVDLFEPGRANLSDAGRNHLSALAAWLEAGKVSGSEVVVVTYIDPNSPELPAAAAQTMSQKQSEAVAAFLHDSLKAHRTGWLSSRKLTPLGMGHNPPPVPEKDPLPASRTEILVFSPR